MNTLNISSKDGVQISIIRRNGTFDNGPQTPLAFNFQ